MGANIVNRYLCRMGDKMQGHMAVINLIGTIWVSNPFPCFELDVGEARLRSGLGDVAEVALLALGPD